MFYVSSKNDKLIGVTDTSDNIEEFYTLEQISTFISRGVKITGVFATILFSLSSKFLKEHKDEIKIDYNSNKPEEVVSLIRQLKKKYE